MSLTETPQQLADLTLGWSALRRPVWMFDPASLRGVYANPPALALWNAQSLEELLARDFSNLSEAVRARTRRLAAATRSGGEVSERWTFYPQGEPVTVQATISSILLAGRGLVLLFEASRAEVEAAERRSVEALRHASTAVTLFDDAGRALFTNPAAFIAYGSEDLGFAERFPAGSAGGEVLRRALQGEVVSEVVPTTTRAGARWHHIDARQVLDPVTGAPGVLLNECDVTARVEAEAARAAAEQKAAMAEARQHFLADMSHELRTPLNAVMGFAELLLRSQDPEQVRFARHIKDGGTQLGAVVDQMIALADPEALARDAAGEDEEAVHLGAPEEETALQILYVDDNPGNRALMTAMLSALGLACQTACDGEEGVRAARASHWDLILMDVRMPGMDGVQATREIRATLGPIGSIPIVAVTANTHPEEVASYRAAGMNDVLAKPLEMAKLIDMIQTWTAAPSGEDAALCA